MVKDQINLRTSMNVKYLLYTRAEITFSRYIVSFNQSYIQDMKKYNLVE